MKIDKLRESIKVVNDFKGIIENKFKIFEEVDIIYRSRYGVDDIKIFEEDNEMVEIICDNSYGGDYDLKHHNISIDWFLLNDDELRILLEKEKREREEEKRLEEEENKQKQLREKEAKDLAKYEELRKKFEK